MMKKFFILVCVCLLIILCNSNFKNINDFVIFIEIMDMYNVENLLDYDGIYIGIFLVVDCLGINMILIIKKDKIFELILEYIDW